MLTAAVIYFIASIAIAAWFTSDYLSDNIHAPLLVVIVTYSVYYIIWPIALLKVIGLFLYTQFKGNGRKL